MGREMLGEAVIGQHSPLGPPCWCKLVFRSRRDPATWGNEVARDPASTEVRSARHSVHGRDCDLKMDMPTFSTCLEGGHL